VGEEHRYYTGANKYTALFWNVPNPDSARFTLHVISVEDYKAVTEPVSFSLPAPTRNAGPMPVELTDRP